MNLPYTSNSRNLGLIEMRTPIQMIISAIIIVILLPNLSDIEPDMIEPIVAPSSPILTIKFSYL